MSSVKTAISLEAPLLQAIDDTAAELHIPRSRLLARAAREFLQRYQNAKLLQSLNEAHVDGPTDEEIELGRARKRRHRHRVEGNW